MPQKLDEIVRALKRENPSWSDERVWATAQVAYKKWKKKHHGKR